MKHVFQSIPSSSYNMKDTIFKNEKHMKTVGVLLLLILTTSSVLTVIINADVNSPVKIDEYYQPGDTVQITVNSTPGTVIQLEIMNSLGTLHTGNVTTALNGVYTFTYELANNTPPDLYKIIISQKNETQIIRFHVTNINQDKIIENMFNIVQRVKDQADLSFYKLESTGKDYPEEATEEYEKGLELLETAYTYYYEGDNTNTLQTLRKSLHHFRNVIQIIFNEIGVTPTEAAEIQKIAVRVKQKHRILEEYLKKYNKSIIRLEEEGIDVTVFKSLFTSALRRLSEIEEMINNGHVREAESELETLLTKVKNYAKQFRQIHTRLKLKFINRYLTNLENRLIYLKRILTVIRPYSSLRVNNALNKINNLQIRLLQAKANLAIGKINTAYIELITIKEILDETLLSVNGETIGRKLLLYDQLNAQSQILNATQQTNLQHNREDTIIDSQITQTNQRIKDVVESLEENKSLKPEYKYYSSITNQLQEKR